MNIIDILNNYDEDENGCWNWKGSVAGSKSYGQVRLPGGNPTFVHRIVADTLIQPLIKGNVVHHICNNPLCINPGHLEVVSGQSEHRMFFHGSRTLKIKLTIDEHQFIKNKANEVGVTINEYIKQKCIYGRRKDNEEGNLKKW